MDKLNRLIQLAMRGGQSFIDAVQFAFEYKGQATWEPLDDEDQGWSLNQAIILHHRIAFFEDNKYWRGQLGQYEGQIALVVFQNGRFELFQAKSQKLMLEFTPAEIAPWWKPGNKIEFFRPDLGYIELDTIYYLPSSLAND